VGEKLAKKEPLDLRGEGLTALPFVVKRLGDAELRAFPLIASIRAISEGKSADEAFGTLF
jgi:hypothetical protein